MSENLERVVIVGSSGHSIAALDATLRMNKHLVVGWLDSFKSTGEIVAGYEILGHPNNVARLMIQHRFTKVFLGISNNHTRRLVWEKMRTESPELKLATIIHPQSCISPSAHIGEGSLIMGGAIVNPGCRVGQNCIVNTKSSLDHDSEMKPYSSILPGVTTGGNVTIGICSCICLNATLSHRVSIGDHSYVGAASLVLRDIPDRVLAYGAPARVVRSRNEDDKHF